MKPSTGTILGNFPSNKARPVKIHRRKSTHGSILKKDLVDESNTPPPSAGATPSQAKMASTTPGSLQLDIALWIHERICKSSPSLTLSLT